MFLQSPKALTFLFSCFVLSYSQEKHYGTSDERLDNRPLSCSFNRNFCGWVANTSLLTITPRFKREDNSDSPLPLGTHFAFARFTNYGSTELMSSRLLNLSHATQISFRYFVYDYLQTSTRKFFRLSVVPSGREPRVLWNIEWTDVLPTNTWLPARAVICEESEFRLLFEIDGSSRNSISYDGVGLADLIINNETTAFAPVKPTNIKNCSAVLSHRSRSSTCGPTAKNSTSEFCGWQINGTDLTWKLEIYKPNFPSIVTQRSEDAYLYVETAYHKDPKTLPVTIQSPLVWLTKPTGLLSFWFRCEACDLPKSQLVASEDGMTTNISIGKLNVNRMGVITSWTPQVFRYDSKNFSRNSSVTFAFDISFRPGGAWTFGLDKVWYSAELGFEEDIIVSPASVFPTTFLARKGTRSVNGILKSSGFPTLFTFQVTATSKLGAVLPIRANFTDSYSYELTLEADDDYMLVFEACGYYNVTVDVLSVMSGEDALLEDILLISDTITGNGTVLGKVVSAANDSSASSPDLGPTITFRSGINAWTGPTLRTIVMPTASDTFSVSLPTGYYTAEVKVKGFATAFTSVTAINGSDQTSCVIAVSPVIGEKETRIILTWTAGENAETSLKAHLIPPDGEDDYSEVSAFSKNERGSTIGTHMDADGWTRAGLESITVQNPKAGVYRFSVRLYSVAPNGPDEAYRNVLATSGAKVQVVRGSAVIRTYNVPSENGTLWNVFEMDGNGSISRVNKMSYGNWTVTERTTTLKQEQSITTISSVSSTMSAVTGATLTTSVNIWGSGSVEDHTTTQEQLRLESTKESPNETPTIVGVSVSVVILLILACISIALFLCHRKRKSERAQLKRSNDNVHRPSNSYILRAQYPASKSHLQSLITQYTKLLEVSYESLEIDTGKALGRGEFGIVYRGLAHHLPTISRGPTTVAVKTLLKSADPAQQSQFFDEFKVMMKAGRHVNIVNILGIVHDGPMLIIEYCRFGSLLSYLRSRRTNKVYSHVDEDGVLLPLDKFEMEHQWRTVCEKEERVPESEEMGDYMLSTNDLIRFANQISSGMEYLALRSIIHRDLAARNVLVSDDKILKISDFGLARHGGESYTVSNVFTALPILWMPPDAIINREFSEKSDVWSFGVLLWEIFSIGQVPFDQPNVTKFSAQAFASWLLEGHQMDRPKCSPLAIFDLMKLCWKINKLDRPTFASIWSTLDALVRNMDGGASYLSFETMDDTFTELNEQILSCLTEEPDVLEDAL